jgi:ABC-2 type transport system permease protein
LATAFPHLDLVCGVIDWIMLVVMILSSGLIYIGINLFFAMFSFWMVDSLPVVYAVFNLIELLSTRLPFITKPFGYS